MEGFRPLLMGSQPPAMLAFVLFVAALIHPYLLPAEQQVSDLVTWLYARRVLAISAVIGSSSSLSPSQ